MLDYLAFNIALLQVGEDIVQLFIRCHYVHPELPENTVGGLRHFAVQDVKRQAVAQGQFTDDRPVRAVPGEGELDDRALQLICQFGIEGLFLRIIRNSFLVILKLITAVYYLLDIHTAKPLYA